MRIILDTDPGIDDAIALLLALASPELELRGITTVSGNVDLPAATANALRVLELAGRSDISVAPGCDRPLVRPIHHAHEFHGADGLGEIGLPRATTAPAAEHALDLITREVLDGEPVTLIAVGPLTNVALLCALRPAIVARLDRLIVMGGAIARGNVRPNGEFNTWADPEAAQRVLAAEVPTTWIGLDVTHKATLAPDDVDELRAGGAAAQAAAAMLDFYGSRELTDEPWAAPMHDALAVACAIDPTLIETRAHPIEIDCGGELSRGTMIVSDDRHTDLPANGHVAIGVDAPRFARLLVERISAI